MKTGVEKTAQFGAQDGSCGDAYEMMVDLEKIEIEAQVREEFEDDENSLAELAASLRHRQIQSIVLRPNRAGREKPYLLVAGERRIRAARLGGLTQLRARVEDLTDEEAEDVQFAENIQRKNLTQLEEARRVQRDLDQLGDVDAVLAKYNKGRAWLSKILGLLSLPEQTKRLITENISADLEVINSLKVIEKANGEAAAELVNDLKRTRGKENARQKVGAVKDEVKPRKSKSEKGQDNAGGGTVATPRDRSGEVPGEVKAISAGEKNHENDDCGDSSRIAVSKLAAAFANVVEFGSEPKMVLDVMSGDEHDAIEAWLSSFYDAGRQAENVGRAVMQGFRNGQFGSVGCEAFALVAFLQGAEDGAKFSLLDILGSVKP